MKQNLIYAQAKIEYERWVDEVSDKAELGELAELSLHKDEMLDAFRKELHFGTSGMRGIMGMGTNRMNIYTVRRVTAALGDYLLREKIAGGDRVFRQGASVVIAFDSRKHSRLFALEVYNTLTEKGIKVYIFDDITPVSLLSYAIGRLGCDMGVMITASHNPKIFNGYKVYNSHGYQIVGDDPRKITEICKGIDYFDYEPPRYDCDFLAHSISDDFIAEIVQIGKSYNQPKDVKDKLKIVYTPLNGAGSRYVMKVLRAVEFDNVFIVPVQEKADENFTTCPAPNPENIAAYVEAFKTFDEMDADIIIATDPDSDRVGMAISDDGTKMLLSGNQLGILILDYMCTVNPPRPGMLLVKSIVSTPLVERMAQDKGIKVINTLTGFKYIGKIIAELASEDRASDYYFGFEESNGYLVSPFVRDKDGVSGAMLGALMASYHKSRGTGLLERLEQIYEQYGCCLDKTISYTFEGPTSDAVIGDVMSFFRNNVREQFAGHQICRVIDYLVDDRVNNEQSCQEAKSSSAYSLPSDDSIQFDFVGGSRLIIRPSGTEAKIKAYIFAINPSRHKAGSLIKELEDGIKVIIGRFKGE